MDPLSITAGVVGVVVPALHCVRLLVDDLQKIADAPDAVKALKDDLVMVDNALTSLQSVSDVQWKSLGEGVVSLSKNSTQLCSDSCNKFRTALAHWTRHSTNGTLSWQDRATIGLIKQSQIKSMSERLQTCKTTLISVASIATL